MSYVSVVSGSMFDVIFTTPVPAGSNVMSALDGDMIVDPLAVRSPNPTLVRLEPSPANAVAVTVPDTCSAVDGSEVPIPTRQLVTSK